MSESISELIQRRLRDLNLSKAELAKRLGVSRAYVGSLANATAKTPTGIYRPRPNIVSGLAHHLHVSETDVLASLGYNVESTERIELLEGVTIQFDRSADLSETDKKQILDAVRLIAAGVRAEHSDSNF